jgi:trehalose/maltose hydrolase-like predicted phosphorylase
VLHNRLGNRASSEEQFVQGYKPNEVPPFGVVAETAGGDNPYFATGAGGMLQAVLAGFGGLEITDGGIVQVPSLLPSSWSSLQITGVGHDQQVFSVQSNNKGKVATEA